MPLYKLTFELYKPENVKAGDDIAEHLDQGVRATEISQNTWLLASTEHEMSLKGPDLRKMFLNDALLRIERVTQANIPENKFADPEVFEQLKKKIDSD